MFFIQHDQTIWQSLVGENNVLILGSEAIDICASEKGDSFIVSNNEVPYEGYLI